jgi:hypothetical protein
MKACPSISPISVAAAAALALMAGFGCASQQNSSQSSPPDSKRSEPSYVTGSYIPRDLQRNGPVTDGANNLRIIDESEIERSGGADTTQTLRQLGVTH